MPSIGSPTASTSTGVRNVRDYGAKCDVRLFFTGTLTASSTSLTDSAGTFTSADVGKVLFIDGAVRTVVSVQSATALTMSAPSGYNSTSAAYAIGTDDTAAMTAAFASLPRDGGTLLVPGLTFDSASRSFTERTGIRLQGVGGRLGLSRTKGNGLTNLGTGVPASGLIYTGTGSGPYIKFMDCLNCSFTDMAILYAQTTYAGDLVSFMGSNGSTPGMFFTIKDCLLNSLIASDNYAANCLVNLSGAVFVNLQDNAYGFAKYHIIGLDPDAASKGATAGFSNAVTIMGGATEFAEALTACVLNPGSSWQFFGITFEPLRGATTGAVRCHTSTKNLLFSGCGFWDNLNPGVNPTVLLKGERISFRDCYFEGTGLEGIHLDASTASVGGLLVEGCQFDGIAGGAGQTALKPPASGSGFTLSSLWFKANTFKNGTPDPTAALQANGQVVFAT